VHMDRWREVIVPEIVRILARPGCRTWVACWAGETDRVNDLKGWIAVERGYEVVQKIRRGSRWIKERVRDPAPLVHYLYVRDGWRRSDGHQPAISAGLCAAADVDPGKSFRFTCRTPVCSRLDLRNGVWSPLIARFDPPKELTQ